MGTKKDLIYKGALKAFSEHEFNETTMDYIAEVSSVAKGTLYYYFKTKEDLFLFVLEKGIDKLLQQIEYVTSSSLPREEMLTKLLKVHLKFFSEEKELCQLLVSKIWGAKNLQLPVQKLTRKYFEKMETFFTELQNEGYITSLVDIPTLASSLFGMILFTSLRRIELGEEVYTREIIRSLALLCKGALRAGEVTHTSKSE